MFKLTSTLLILIWLTSSEGLRCYVCTMGESETSDLCIVSPSSASATPAVECNLRYCTIRRQEYQNPAGRVASFHRGCESNPVHLNTMIDSGEYRTYYRACSSNLCNVGNGIQPVSDSSGARSNLTTLLVPGTGVSSSHKAVPLISCLITCLTSLLLTALHHLH